jgi:hypothetical protein
LDEVDEGGDMLSADEEVTTEQLIAEQQQVKRPGTWPGAQHILVADASWCVTMMLWQRV